MRTAYNEVLKKIEKESAYEIAMSRMLNEIVVGEKSINKINDEFNEYEEKYVAYLDMLDSLDIDEDELTVIESLLEKIEKYNFIKELINETVNNNKIVGELDNTILKKNKHTINLLAIINKNPGISHDDLARKLGLEKSNLTKAINSIEKLDLISKTKDGRNVFYFLTANGKKYNKLIKKSKSIVEAEYSFNGASKPLNESNNCDDSSMWHKEGTLQCSF